MMFNHNTKSIWRVVSEACLLLCIFMSLSGRTRAQSTDPSNPTPITSGTVSGQAGPSGATYYYRFQAPQGSVTVTLKGRTNNYSTQFEADVVNMAGIPLGEISFSASDTASSASKNFSFDHVQPVTIVVKLLKDSTLKLQQYSLTLSGATSSGNSDGGSGVMPGGSSSAPPTSQQRAPQGTKGVPQQASNIDPQETLGPQVDANAYGLGVSMGLASFQASRVQGDYQLGEISNLVLDELKQARKFAYLVRGNIKNLDVNSLEKMIKSWDDYDSPLPPVQQSAAQLPSLRGSYSATLRKASPRAGDVFDLGVDMAIAEGQATVGEDARSIVRSSLVNARGSASALGLNVSELNSIIAQVDQGAPIADLYNQITYLRGKYQASF